MQSVDSLKVKAALTIEGEKKEYQFFSLQDAAIKLGFQLAKLPNSIKILFENLLRHEDGKYVSIADIQAIPSWLKHNKSEQEVAFFPARVLMQDFTGVPAIVDLAAMRDAVLKKGGDPKKINPLIPVDLVIDHSVQVDKYGSVSALLANTENEMNRNKERYEFLRWGQDAFDNFRVVPPGTGICHQVNLEFFAKVVWSSNDLNKYLVFPDTLVGTDSHTTMINGLSVLGWGVGGIEAEAAMLGQPISMVLPEVVGVKLVGKLKHGINATDLVITITNVLRSKGVVGKFVEFYGPGLSSITLADRATIANMSPEYGATCGFFTIDDETIKYLELTGRTREQVALVKKYAKTQLLWRDDNAEMEFSDHVEIDLNSVEMTLAGPKRPQDRVLLQDVVSNFKESLSDFHKSSKKVMSLASKSMNSLKDGAVVIAAITSCTNTSNPFVMICAGLLAKNAVKHGLSSKPWVKTSIAPGSQVVTEYLKKSGLDKYLEQLGFYTVGYGCTTCIGNSGPLLPKVERDISENNLMVAAVLSGNRNFEGRIHQLVRANYLASPPLCIAYAIAGNVMVNLATEPLATNASGEEVYLSDIMPTDAEIKSIMNIIDAEMFNNSYKDVFGGSEEWRRISSSTSTNYAWDSSSTYIKCPPYFNNMGNSNSLTSISGARILAILGDSTTTDHISPAGSIAKNSPAAIYLTSFGVQQNDFNSYGSRRGNHEVMMRGTFANIRIKNKMLDNVEGPYTLCYQKNGTQMSIYDAAMEYKNAGVPLVIFAGKEYGTGSSRDWAAKGPSLLGVRAVIAESFERIHRSNLVGMGIIPFMLKDITCDNLSLKGDEYIDISDIESVKPKQELSCVIRSPSGKQSEVTLICRIDTEIEMEYVKAGGILHYMLLKL